VDLGMPTFSDTAGRTVTTRTVARRTGKDAS